MEPFDVYKIYLSLKLHFTTDSYDITKHKYAAKGRKETFLKRKDLMVMIVLFQFQGVKIVPGRFLK